MSFKSIAYHVFAGWGADPRECSPGAREAVANNLAGRLLLPSSWFAADATACGWDLAALKLRYATASHELIARRMLDCAPPVIVSIYDQQQISFRCSNLPGRAPPPLSAEMECWRDVQHGRQPQQTSAGAIRVQGWPIHEPGWQREILRTEIDEWVADFRE